MTASSLHRDAQRLTNNIEALIDDTTVGLDKIDRMRLALAIEAARIVEEHLFAVGNRGEPSG